MNATEQFIISLTFLLADLGGSSFDFLLPSLLKRPCVVKIVLVFSNGWNNRGQNSVHMY